MFTFIFFISWLIFTTLMSLFVLDGWFIILWFILGALVAILVIVLSLIIHIIITSPLKITSKYKNYGYRSVSYFLCRFIFNLRIHVEGKENIPMDGPLVIYSNHKSYLDALLLTQIVKRPIAFTPKSTLYNIPILKIAMKSIGCMPVYRDDTRKTAKSLIKSINDVKDGFAMMVFPEGGRKNRNTDEVINSLSGAYKLASKSEANILPVSINGSASIQHNAPFKKTKISIKVHDLISYDNYKDKTTNEISQIVATKINEGIIK